LEHPQRAIDAYWEESDKSREDVMYLIDLYLILNDCIPIESFDCQYEPSDSTLSLTDISREYLVSLFTDTEWIFQDDYGKLSKDFDRLFSLISAGDVGELVDLYCGSGDSYMVCPL